jgi:arylsulfatase A-like enzyme
MSWGAVGRSLLPWYVAAAYCFYAKYQLLAMDNGAGFRLAASTLGRIGHEAFETNAHLDVGLTVFDKLTFFREDAIVMLVVIPVLLLLVTRLLPYRLRTPVTVIFSLCTLLLVAVQVRAYLVLGRFVSFEMARLAISWGWSQSEAVSAYLRPEHLLLLLLVAVSACIVAWTLWRYAKRRRKIPFPLPESGSVSWSIGGAVVTAALLLGVTCLWLPRVASTPFHRSLVTGAVQALWDTGEVDTREFLGLSTRQLMQRYREITNSPVHERDPRYWAKCKSCNVLLFVFETGADRFMPDDDSLDDLPNYRRLRQRAFVATNQYTTYPLTSRALYSILTSWYPSDTMKADVEQHPDMVLPGFTRDLAASGYQTAVYSPKHFNRDDAMFQIAGIQQQKLPKDLGGISQTQNTEAPWMQERIGRDNSVLRLMKQDLENWLLERKQFSVMFLPQVGHHPWPDYAGNTGETDPLKRARAVIAMQDVWLGELIDLLERHRALDQTLVVVTGDHGIRSREEDPSLDGGMIDEYSFHVPLLLYAPGVLDHSETIPWLTSHIDIAPTLLDLLGIEEGRDFEQGIPLWTPGLARRTTYFFAYHMFGADGYYSNGKFYMWSRVSGSVYANDRQHFTAADVVLPGTALSAGVKQSISRMAGLQQVWDARFAKGNALRTRVFNGAAE